MRRRLITTFSLLAIAMPAVILGGILYYLLIGTFLCGATWEYVQMFRAVKFEPQIHITIGGVAVIGIVRMFYPQFAMPVFAAIILAALTYHVIRYERGRDEAAIDFGITAAGLTYLGWIGAYLFNLRTLPDGGWWLMIVLPCIWLGDSGAYSIGRYYGKHKMAPRLSPKKSWEGYAASIFTGMIAGAFFVYAYHTFGNFHGHITILQGAILGLIMGAIPPIGDLGESMFKRQSGIKDSSDVIPGHGGFFDRIDSWVFGAVIGYYFLIYFIL
jgi:phosphatidate cytidylyltransferase